MRFIVALLALAATALPALAFCPLPSGCVDAPPPVRVPIQPPPQQRQVVPQQQVIPQQQYVPPHQATPQPQYVPQPQPPVYRQVVPQQLPQQRQVVPQQRGVPQVQRQVGVQQMQQIQQVRSVHQQVYVQNRAMFTFHQSPMVQFVAGQAVPWVVFTEPNGAYIVHDEIRYYGWVGVRPTPAEDFIWVMMDERYINMGGDFPSIYAMLQSGDAQQLGDALALVWGSAQMQGLVPMDEFDENNPGN